MLAVDALNLFAHAIPLAKLGQFRAGLLHCFFVINDGRGVTVVEFWYPTADEDACRIMICSLLQIKEVQRQRGVATLAGRDERCVTKRPQARLRQRTLIVIAASFQYLEKRRK